MVQKIDKKYPFKYVSLMVEMIIKRDFVLILSNQHLPLEFIENLKVTSLINVLINCGTVLLMIVWLAC